MTVIKMLYRGIRIPCLLVKSRQQPCHKTACCIREALNGKSDKSKVKGSESLNDKTKDRVVTPTKK